MQAKMQWVHDPSRSNVDHLHNVRREVPTTYKISSKILLWMLTLYAEEITGNHQYGFRRNR